MKFYDREIELDILRKNRERSKNSGVLTVMTGRRRIGKTALIKESEKGNRFLYFFVPRNSETLICEQLVDDAMESMGIELINSGRFRDLFKQLMIYGQDNDFTFVIDEFQELARADEGITSSIQNLWDSYKDTSKVNLIVCGSVHSMMIRIFRDYKEPLYGRANSNFNIDPFRPSVVKQILKDHNQNYKPDDLLSVYMLTGGVPKYIAELMDNGATTFDKMLDFVCSPSSLFLTDGKDLLISEFGKEYGTYFSILKLISKGKTLLNEINTSIGVDCSQYLNNLEKDYNIVKRNRPIFSKDNSRDVRWRISDNYLRFYFRSIDSNQSLIEMKHYDLLREKIREDYSQYSGLVLQDYFKEKIAEEEKVTKIGSHWDRKGENEIDIIALNDMDMTATIIEVKRNPEKASLEKLKERAGIVSGLNEFRTDHRVLSLKDM
ncbi:MAG: ATP-binding protein [Methanomassiliicoccaceae archaeon]|nr:ATP-binding protein [Methanomassiliicoccaceae archaeon]